MQSYQLIDARDAILTRASVEKTTALHSKNANSRIMLVQEWRQVLEREDTVHKCGSGLLVGVWKTLTSWPFICLARDQP
jgi:hypothetical protein